MDKRNILTDNWESPGLSVYNVDMIVRRPFIFADPHFWAVVLLFVIGIILHYPQEILAIQSPSVFSFLGLSRHAVERIFFLIPIGYANYFLGNRAGWISLAISALVMIPRTLFISDYIMDSIFETGPDFSKISRISLISSSENPVFLKN